MKKKLDTLPPISLDLEQPNKAKKRFLLSQQKSFFHRSKRGNTFTTSSYHGKSLGKEKLNILLKKSSGSSSSPTFPDHLRQLTFKNEILFKRLMDNWLKKRNCGKCKCMRAILVNSKDEKTKAVKDYCMAICRDFAGTFGIFVVELAFERSVKLKELKNVHELNNKISVLKIQRHYEMNINDEIYKFSCEHKSVELFEDTVLYVLKQYVNNIWTKKTFLRKIGSVKFVQSFQKPHKEENSEKIIHELIDKIVTFKGSFTSQRQKTYLAKLRKCLRVPKQRDIALLKLLDKFKEANIEKLKLLTLLKVYKIILYNPNTSENPLILFKYQKVFRELYKGFKEIGKEQNIKELIQSTENLCKAQIIYERGYSKRYLFDYVEGFLKDTYVAEEIKSPKHIHNGVYLGVILWCKKEEKHIMVSSNNNSFPFIQVMKRNGSNFNEKEDFNWILNFGANFSETIVQNWESYNFERLSPFQSNFIRSVISLSKSLNVNSLGDLYYQPIVIDEKTILIVSSKEVKSEQTLPDGYIWTELDTFEHIFYERYFNLNKYDPIEFIDIDYNKSIRFINFCVSNNQQKKLKEGFYLGYLGYVVTEDGIKILVNRKFPNIIPAEYVSHHHPNEEEVRLIQKIRFDKTFDTFLTVEETENLYENELLRERNFKQNFYLSYLRLKKKFPNGVKLDNFFDSEVIVVDEDHTVSMFLFVKQHSRIGLSEELGKDHQFLEENIFEMVHHHAFNNKCFSIFNNQKIKYFISNNCSLCHNEVYSIDELFRHNLNVPKTPIHGIIDVEKKWRCMRWDLRGFSWVHNGSKPIAQSEDIQSFSDFDLNLKESLKRYDNHHFRQRNIIINSITLKLREDEKWEKIGKKLEGNIKTITKNKSFSFDDEVQSEMIHETVNCNFSDIYDLEHLQEEPLPYDYCKIIFDEIVEISMAKSENKRNLKIGRKLIDDIIETIEKEEKEEFVKQVLESRMNSRKTILQNFKIISEKYSYDKVIGKMCDNFVSNIEKYSVLVQIINSVEEMNDITQNIQNIESLRERMGKVDIQSHVFKKNLNEYNNQTLLTSNNLNISNLKMDVEKFEKEKQTILNDLTRNKSEIQLLEKSIDMKIKLKIVKETLFKEKQQDNENIQSICNQINETKKELVKKLIVEEEKIATMKNKLYGKVMKLNELEFKEKTNIEKKVGIQENVEKLKKGKQEIEILMNKLESNRKNEIDNELREYNENTKAQNAVKGKIDKENEVIELRKSTESEKQHTNIEIPKIIVSNSQKNTSNGLKDNIKKDKVSLFKRRSKKKNISKHLRLSKSSDTFNSLSKNVGRFDLKKKMVNKIDVLTEKRKEIKSALPNQDGEENRKPNIVNKEVNDTNNKGDVNNTNTVQPIDRKPNIVSEEVNTKGDINNENTVQPIIKQTLFKKRKKKRKKKVINKILLDKPE